MKFEAIKLDQGKHIVFSTKMKVSDLSKIADIDYSDPENSKKGYQRKPKLSRYIQIANYITESDCAMPPAIIAAYRGNLTQKKSNNSIVQIEFSTEDKVWVIDGQHRLGGLKLAAGLSGQQFNKKITGKYKKFNDTFRNFEMPVVIIECPTIHEEAKLFADINSNSQKVDKFLAALALLLDSNAKSTWETRATSIVTHLNEQKDSALYGKLKHPSKTGRGYFCTSKGLMVLLKPLTNHKMYADEWDKGETEREKIFCMIKDYWNALQKEMPFCFNDHINHALFKNAGIIVAIQCLLSMINKIGKRYPNEEQFRNVINKLGKYKTEEYWHKNSQDGVNRCIGEAQASNESRKLITKIDSL